MQYKLAHFEELKMPEYKMTLENETYDTILLLMNGAGMCGDKKYSEFPTKTKITLKSRRPNFIRQSDIIYMFDDDEDGGNGFHPIMNIMER
jgi:hypothetical protein